MPPKKMPASGLPSLSSSFIAAPPSAPISSLPDIYTTCPELRKFTPLFTLGAGDPPAPAPAPAKMDPPAPVPRFPCAFQTPCFQMFNPNALIVRPFACFR
jgi:hypothetical protein